MSVGTARVSMAIDKRIALRMRQLLSGHVNTWVMLEGTDRPERRTEFSDGRISQSRTVRLRVEEYVGQYSDKAASERRKQNIRDARDSALILEVLFDSRGRCRAVKANGIKLTNSRGWFAYRLKQIIGGLVGEVEAVTGISSVPQGNSGITRVLDHGDDMFSYVRRRDFIYERTDRINRRGASGQIHISEPTSARHSAYPGW